MKLRKELFGRTSCTHHVDNEMPSGSLVARCYHEFLDRNTWKDARESHCWSHRLIEDFIVSCSLFVRFSTLIATAVIRTTGME